MPTASKPVVPSGIEDRPHPIATFKNSLRDWLVRWKAERGDQEPVADKAPNQAAPG
jgi:hypothetical protein